MARDKAAAKVDRQEHPISTKGTLFEEPAELLELDPSNILGSGSDLLMWVGYHSYPTIAEFVQEAQVHGISKRISRIPHDLELGKTRIFLAHDEGVKGDGVIFGYGVVDAVEVIVRDSQEISDSVLERIADNHTIINTVTESQANLEVYRGCGRRVVGGIYLRTTTIELETDLEIMSKVVDQVENAEAEAQGGQITILGSLGGEDPDHGLDYNMIIDLNARRFRSFCRVDGDKILESGFVKNYPSQTAPSTIPEELRGISRKAKWTEPERTLLFQMIDDSSPHTASKNYCRQTGRSFQACMYQWRKESQRRQEV